MAKYRITSIPQYKNGGELNKLQGGGNPLYQNNALNKGSLIDQKIVATEKKGMAYQATADELKRLNAQKAQEKAKQEAIKRKAANQKKRDELAKQQLIEQEFNAQINPNKTYSETLGTVAGNAGAAQTQGALDAQIGAKQEYHQKRKFVTDNYLNTNRDALVNEAARSIQNSSNLTYEQALEQAKKDEALLYTLAEKHTPTDSEHLANLANSQDFYDYKNSRNDQINSIDPNDPTHISFENTGTLEGYMQRANDILLNPLDAAHYAISNEKMPYNFSEYEKMKQQTGYRDGADNNAVMGAIDFASWFHPVGLFGQGMKMIEPTAESILKVYDDPTWENAGTAAFDIGMTGLTFLGAKNPLKFLAEEKFAADAATGFRNWNPAQSGPTPPFNTGTGLLPVGVATEVRAASEAATGTTPLLNITPVGFNPKMEIEGATVYNQLLEQKRLQNIAELSKISSSSDPVAINLEAQIAKLKEQEALAEESRKVLWGDYKAGNITAEEYTAGAKKLSPGLEGTNPRFELEKQLREYKVKQDIINVPQQNILQSEEQLGKNISDGGTNTKGVFELGDDHVARLSAWGYDDASLLVKYADKIKSPRIAKTLQVKELNGKVYQVQEKVAGTPIASLTETELQNIPKEHIDNFWKDKAELDNLGLSIDISGGKSNILYDPKKGFQFIDLGIGESSTNEVIAQTYKGLKLPIEETGLVKNVSGTTPLVQEEKVFGVAPTEIIESSTTVPRKNLNDPEYVDDEVVADIIDDMRVNKMELWNTPEGKARLQKMIDNTDSLRSNLEMTPETIIERMGSLNVVNRIRVNTETKLKALGEEEAFIDELYDTGQIDKTEWMDKIMAVDEKRNIQNLLLTEIEKGTENFSGFYDPEFNRIGINPKDYNKKEIKKVTSHEFMHLLGNGRTTYLDDMLNDLDLIEDTSTQLTIPGIGGGEESKAAALFGHDRPDYLKESLDYFKTGSGGTEKVPFISEIRQAMLEDGTIKNEYDKITPDMLKKHYEKYKKNKDEKYPIRLYDIIKDDKKNFTVLSKVLDNLPIVLQAVGMADALFGQEDVDTKEAGFSLLLGAITKGKGKALKAGKGLGKFLGTESGLLSNAYKLNPFAFKVSPENSYRMIGKEGYKDAIESGLIKSKKQIAYPEPYFGKGKIYDGEYSNPKSTAFNPQTGKRIPSKGYPGPYMVESKAPMKGVGAFADDLNPMITTPLEIPKTTNPDYTFYKQHWLQGYKEVPKELPGNFNYNSNAGNLNAGSYADELRAVNQFRKKPLTEKEIEMYVHFKELERFDKLPKTTNKEALEVLENFKTRIKTSEGKERMKNLGIKNDKQLQQIEILEDPNTYGYYTGNENKIAMNPNLPIPELVRHEIEHGVQRAAQIQAYINEGKIIPTIKKLFTDPFDKKGMFDKIEKANTEIDNLLSGLELKKEGTPNKIWNFNVINEKPVDVSLYKPAISDKQKATDYFLTGTEGREKSAFLGEVQQYMMNVGTIPKTGYVKITPEMVKQTMINAMFDEAGRGKYLRLFNIMKPTAANYELIAKGLNKMLGLTPLIGVGLGLGAASQISQKKGGQINNYFELDIPEEDVQKYLDEGYNVKQV